MDDELLQDFLVETGETLEGLNQLLIELEQSPEDPELLNKVFRAFHNVKGGAGFLNLNPLVEICHVAEDVFNVLRQGQRVADAQLMDVVLRAYDVIGQMVGDVGDGRGLDEADAALLDELRAFACPDDGTSAAAPAAASPAPEPVAETLEAAAPGADSPAAGAPSDEISDDEFEALLDELHGAGRHGGAPAESAPAAPPPAPAGDALASHDEISDDEFEALLDELHGEGRHGGVPPDAAAPASTPPPAPAASTPKSGAGGAADEISDDEFEALLDELHGSGRHGGVPASASAATGAAPKKPAAAAPPKPVPAKPEPQKAPARAAAAQPAPRAEAKAPAAAKVDATVRVDTHRLDEIMNMVGELVLVRNRLATLQLTQGNEDLSSAVGNLDVVTADLQLAVMKTRMQPIKKVFGRFPRVVRDLARSLHKEVVLEMQGEETDLDKTLVDDLADPLVHLVRNAVDHGIESPDERERAGKPRAGTVVLTAEQEGDHILITIADDGGGINPDTLRNKAVEKGLMDSDGAARLDDADCYNLIFMPGFSTKTVVSDVSGRGVGMDVVKTRISQLNGTIDIDSEMGRGTRFYIKVPLTLAIMPTLMVVIGNQIFALPLLSIIEIVEYDPALTKSIDGQLVILLRDKALPLFHLREWLCRGAESHRRSSSGHVVISRVGAQRVGLVVDSLLGQEEVVIKPLGQLLQGTPGIAGATITGNGRISLILDVPGLVRAYASRVWEVA